MLTIFLQQHVRVDLVDRCLIRERNYNHAKKQNYPDRA